MREIKFRAWHKQQKRMEPVKMLGLDHQSLFIRIPSDLDPYHPDRNSWDYNEIELMQYTGLHDKNGKEIYESDVLSVEGYDIGVIEYDKGCYRLKSSYYLTACEDTSESLFEVIGNIYENPVLTLAKDE